MIDILNNRILALEKLSEKSSFLEVAYLLIKGELPNKSQFDEFSSAIKNHTMVHEQIPYNSSVCVWGSEDLTLASAGASTLYAAATHPTEAIAAVVWFGVVSGIAAATRRPIDAMIAHAATNLALGAYVLATENWWLL